MYKRQVLGTTGRPLCSVARLDNPAIFTSNGMQPRVSDLQAFGLLEQGFDAALVLPLAQASNVKRANLWGQPSVVSPAPAQFGIIVSTICLQGGEPVNPSPPPAPEAADPCGLQTTNGYADLASTVFNIRPYDVSGNRFGSGARLGAMLKALGGQGFMAQAGSDGNLRAYKSQSMVTNPVTVSNQNGAAGLPGIVAAYHRWGSTEYTMRDGSLPPTQDWNFAAKALNNVSTLGVNGEAKMGAASIRTDLVVGEDATVKRNAYILGRATVSNGAVLYGNSSLDNAKMNAQRVMGGACSTDVDSFARNVDKRDELLVCFERQWAKVAATKAPKTFFFRHFGWYLAEFFVDYTDEGGIRRTARSSNLGRGNEWSTTIPGNASNVVAWGEGHTGLRWSTIFQETVTDSSYRPNEQCYTVNGLAWDMNWNRTCR